MRREWEMPVRALAVGVASALLLTLSGTRAGAQTDTPTVSPTETEFPTPTVTPAPTLTPAESATPTPTESATPTPTPSGTCSCSAGVGISLPAYTPDPPPATPATYVATRVGEVFTISGSAYQYCPPESGYYSETGAFFAEFSPIDMFEYRRSDSLGGFQQPAPWGVSLLSPASIEVRARYAGTGVISYQAGYLYYCSDQATVNVVVQPLDSPTPTSTETPTPSVTETPTPTASPSPSATDPAPSPSISPTPSQTPPPDGGSADTIGGILGGETVYAPPVDRNGDELVDVQDLLVILAR